MKESVAVDALFSPSIFAFVKALTHFSLISLFYTKKKNIFEPVLISK